MRKLAALTTTAFYLLTTKVAFADVPLSISQGTSQGIQASTSPTIIFQHLVTIIFIAAAVLVLVMLLWGGIEWILSGGDKEKVGAARKRIINALIGLLIIALAFVILTVVGNIIGFSISNVNGIPSLGPAS